jgi:hypothetical protein
MKMLMSLMMVEGRGRRKSKSDTILRMHGKGKHIHANM